jgi:hypothetical protein
MEAASSLLISLLQGNAAGYEFVLDCKHRHTFVQVVESNHKYNKIMDLSGSQIVRSVRWLRLSKAAVVVFHY